MLDPLKRLHRLDRPVPSPTLGPSSVITGDDAGATIAAVSLEDEPVAYELDVDDLSDEELLTLAEQAGRTGGPLIERGRFSVAALLLLVQAIAFGKREDRRTGERRVSRGRINPDVTAPLSHQATDVAYALALVLPLVEDAATPAPVRKVWAQLATALRREVDRRGPPA